MITVNSSEEINYNPKNTLEEVVTNVGMILRVCKEEQEVKKTPSHSIEILHLTVIRLIRTLMLCRTGLQAT